MYLDHLPNKNNVGRYRYLDNTKKKKKIPISFNLFIILLKIIIFKYKFIFIHFCQPNNLQTYQ